jgi:cytochrome P450
MFLVFTITVSLFLSASHTLPELMGYVAKYWDQPEEFRPERFMGDYNRDAFIPFAGGPRACIGRR